MNNGSNGDGLGHGNANGHGGTGGRVPLGVPAAGAQRAMPAVPDLARLQRSLGETEEKRRFNASDYLRLLWKGKWIVGACMAVAGLLTAYYTYSLPFVYEASLDIALEKNEDVQMFAQTSMYRNRDRELKNELQFMTSLDVYKLTALRLYHIRFVDTSSQQYRDSTIPLIASAEAALASRLHGAPEEQKIRRIVDHMAGAIQAMTSIQPSKDADIISITTRSGDPREAALITNVYAQVYSDFSRDKNQEKVKGIQDYLTTQVGKTRDMLAEAASDLNQFQKNVGVAGETVGPEDLMRQKSNLETSLSAVNIEINALAGRLDKSKEQLASIEPSYPTELAMALPERITNLTARLAKEEMNLKTLVTLNPKRGSEVAWQRDLGQRRQMVDALRSELQQNVAQYKETRIGSLPSNGLDASGPTGPITQLRGSIFEDEIQLNSLKAKRAAIQQAMSEISSDLSRIPDIAMQLRERTRALKGYEEINKELETQLTKRMIDKQAILSNVRIVSPSEANTNPISPNRRANMVLGTLIGLGLGVGIVLLIAYADTTVHSPDELTEKGFSVLAAIPAIESSSNGRAVRHIGGDETRTGAISPHLIAHSDPDSPITESYRSLRTAIQFASIVEPIRMLLVTSSVPQEGKSTTSANLAIVMANSGMRTLLIDCDLRRPIAHANFGMPKEPGLVNALIGDVTSEEAIRATGIPNLDVLASGSIPPNPSELLGSRRMSDLLEKLRGQYDLVLIDSPPVGVVTDGVILSTKVDATIAVVRAHKTRMEFLDRTNDEVSRVGGPLLGVVLNEFDASQSYGSSYKYYRYYKYYGYYGSNDAGDERKRRRAKTARRKATATN
jgi:capsular exopolysaccharide synthesis family protein